MNIHVAIYVRTCSVVCILLYVGTVHALQFGVVCYSNTYQHVLHSSSQYCNVWNNNVDINWNGHKKLRIQTGYENSQKMDT